MVIMLLFLLKVMCRCCIEGEWKELKCRLLVWVRVSFIGLLMVLVVSVVGIV